MRLFLMGWIGRDFGLTQSALELKKHGHEIVYVVGCDLEKEMDPKDFPGAVFHDHFDALHGQPPARLAGEVFPPPSKALITKLLRAESIVLTMMNKLHGNKVTSERKHFYYNLVQYWNGVLKKFKPDAVIFPLIPHTVYDFVIYHLAKNLDIKTVMFDNVTSIDTDSRLLVMNDFEAGSLDLKKAVEQNIGKKYSLQDLSPESRAFYERHRQKTKGIRPLYLQDFLSKYSGRNLLKIKIKMVTDSLKDFSIFKKTFFFIVNKFRSNLRKEYRQVQAEPDLNKKFIYVPLHYQPERTTSPLGEVYADLLLTVETLSSVLPEDWVVYVKEYPSQWSAQGPSFTNYRYEGYYRHLAGLKNVKVVPLEANTYDLIDNCQAVATVTGTPGWEALIRNRPALVFGDAWYKYCPGAFPIDGPESCQRALEKLKDGFEVDQQKTINFLISFDQVSIQGYVNMYDKDLSRLSSEDNIKNLTAGLLRGLENEV